jgi:phosphate transport system substrate-binding protein
MLKKRHLVSIGALLLVVMAGSSAIAQVRETLRIVGSSTVFPFATTVAEHFGKSGKYRIPVVESNGTGGGFKLFCGGVGLDTPDIMDASRPITASERAACLAKDVRDIDEIKIGFDGIVVAQAKQGSAFNLTLDQLYRAVAKTVPVNGQLVANPYRNWSDVDASLPKRPIFIFGPASNHGTRDKFVELVMMPACKKVPAIKALAADAAKKLCATVREDGQWVDVSEDYALVMGKLKNDKSAVGIFTFSYLDQNRDKIEAATIDHVAASVASISAGTYAISRPLFIYIKHAHLGKAPGLGDFVREFVSDKASGPDGYLTDKSLIALPTKMLREQQALAKDL